MTEAEQDAITAAVARQLESFCGGLDSRVRLLAAQCAELRTAVEDQAAASTRLGKKLHQIDGLIDAPRVTVKNDGSVDVNALVALVSGAVTRAVMAEVAKCLEPIGRQLETHDKHLALATDKMVAHEKKLGRAKLLEGIIKKAFVDVANRIELVERKTGGVRWRGVWEPGAQVQPGEFWTDGGSVWHCNEASADRPGTGSKAWSLAVKRGRDGHGSR